MHDTPSHPYALSGDAIFSTLGRGQLAPPLWMVVAEVTGVV